MATTYYSDHVVLAPDGVTNTIEPRYNPTGVQMVQCVFNLSAAFVINDLVHLLDIPPNVFMENVKIDTPALDSNGSPLITLSIGTAGTPGMFLNASTIGQLGGVVSGAIQGNLGRTFTTTTRLILKVAAAPATGVTTGKIVVSASYLPQQ